VLCTFTALPLKADVPVSTLNAVPELRPLPVETASEVPVVVALFAAT